ncbi:ABC transporter ATP-binding protein [Paenibacillus albus]|uniref:ABC transporter ATP-binding protein n=1 Tax=Paenibacillus albus TaxID=2495582 RepID=A0A3S9A5S9_9BACL|nr:ABC transporter ATP-binding protein [Paenibacillus albus]AZN41107.1 ABC transporter ATP-binding protein [Paenibacillus albus]
MTEVLKVNGLTKRIDQRTIVEDISFSVQKGEIFGLLGPNGAGKTTTIRMLVGLAKPTAGTVQICGHDVQTARRFAMQEIGTIVENPELYPYLSGFENLIQFARLSGVVDMLRVAAIIRLVGLEERIHDKVRRYSLGMRQRLGLAQALLHDPSLLILDEPTNGLDPSGIREFRDLLLQLTKQGKSILISSHLLAELEMMCDRVGVINRGKWVTTATLADLRRGSMNDRLTIEVNAPEDALRLLKSVHPELQIFRGEGNEIDILEYDDILNHVLSTLIQNNVEIHNIDRKKQTLEDVFLQMTGGATA